MRIDDSLQMTGRLSEIVNSPAILLLNDFLESRFELAHALAGIARKFLFEFLSRAQTLSPWRSDFRNCYFRNYRAPSAMKIFATPSGCLAMRSLKKAESFSLSVGPTTFANAKPSARARKLPIAMIMPLRNLSHLPTFENKSKNLNVVIEAVRGTGVKLDYNPDNGAFELSYIMPAGTVFPFEFGFVPSTLGEDGDPLDILVLMDAPTCVGCLLVARPIGVIEAKQTQ